MKNNSLIILFLGLAFGIVGESSLRFGFYFSVLFFLLSIVFSFLKYFKERQFSFFLLSLFFLGVALGAVRTDYSDYKYNQTKNNLNIFIGVPHSFEGIVFGGVSHKEQTVRFSVSLDSVLVNGEKEKIKGSVYVTASREIDVSHGDTIQFFGTIAEPKSFVTDKGSIFNYQEYLTTRGVHAVVLYPKINKIEGIGINIIGKLVYLKNSFEEKAKTIFPEPEASLLNGILFGTNDSLGEPLTANLKKTSTIHIAVLSGYNIALVVVALLFLTSFLPKRISILFSVCGIILFVTMVGAEPPAVRSAIMAVIALLGIILGRPYDAGRALFIAMVLMLLENPAIYSNPSFILSCLATFGIIFFTPIVSLFFPFLTNRYNFRELFSTTISAQFSVTPYLIYLTGLFSVTALPANILILPAIPFIMIFGSISVLASFIIGIFALPFIAITHALLTYLVSVVSFFGGLFFTAVLFSGFSKTITFLVYGLIVVVFLFTKKLIKK